MSTRSVIGVVDADGSVKAVYCHFNGYPSHMVSAITGYVSRNGYEDFSVLISRAINEGGMRQMDANAAETYGRKEDPATWSYTRDDIANGCHQEWCYLVGRNCEIVEIYNRDNSKNLVEVYSSSV